MVTLVPLTVTLGLGVANLSFADARNGTPNNKTTVKKFLLND
jgi:hypothetical protein